MLPKGTILFANTWAIHRCKEEYNDPDDFIPERFLNNKFGTIDLATVDDYHRRVTYGFGAGRRVCPGQRLAENSLVSICASEVPHETYQELENQHGQDRLGLQHYGWYF